MTRRRIERTGTGSIQQVAMMERAIVRMERLITDLLNVSRIEAGQFALRPEWCDLVALCRAVCEEQEAINNRLIQVKLPEKSINVRVDPERVSQVITESSLKRAQIYRSRHSSLSASSL